MKSKKSLVIPIVISNAGPLIHLTKANALNLLQRLYHKILIPIEVEKEAIEKGKEKGAPNAIQIEKAINQGWIKTISITLNPEFQEAAKTAGLHPAEAAVIQYAYENHAIALLDDEPARTFAKTLGITIRGTLGILIQAHKQHLTTHQQALRLLDKLSEIMYLSAELYKLVRKNIERQKTKPESQTIRHLPKS